MDNDNAHIISLRNIQQVKRTIIAKEISDHAFLSCTPTSALRRDQLSLNYSLNTGATNTSSVSTRRMRSYRWVLFTTCTMFLASWIPYFICDLISDSLFLFGENEI